MSGPAGNCREGDWPAMLSRDKSSGSSHDKETRARLGFLSGHQQQEGPPPPGRTELYGEAGNNLTAGGGRNTDTPDFSVPLALCSASFVVLMSTRESLATPAVSGRGPQGQLKES